MTLKPLYLLICGVLLAGIIHIAIILLIPDYGSRDAWNIISGRSEMWQFTRFSEKNPSVDVLQDTDPYLKMGACTFDLSENGLRFQGARSTTFWSASVFDQDGKVLYSLNNRTSIDDRLDLIVLNPVQMIALRREPPEEIERSVVVEADIDKGFVVLRQFQTDASAAQAVDEFLDKASCGKYKN